jgi:general secretion pathway protein D
MPVAESIGSGSELRQVAAAEVAALTPPAPDSGIAIAVAAPKNAQRGNVIEVVLIANVTSALRGLPIMLSYDPAHLKFQDFGAGELLETAGETSVAHSVDTTAGRVSLAIVRNSGAGFAGSGVLGRLRFAVLEAGMTQVQVLSATPLGAQAPVGLPALPPPTAIEVQ